MAIGSGRFRYETEEGWGKVPEGYEFPDAPGVTVDSKDNVYVLNRGPHPVIVFDKAGNFHSEALTVVERYSPVSADVIQYEATMTDPKVFTRPWKISLPLYRHLEKNAQVLEFKCVPFAEELVYGHLRKK